jgi:class 3 adenylate cyclase
MANVLSPKRTAAIQKISLYSLVYDRARDSLMTSLVPTLLATSHGIEDAVIRNQLRGTFYAGFQRLSAFLPQAQRFARLASACGDVLVFALPDVPPPEIPGVQFVLLDPAAPLTEEWFIVFAHDTFVAALLTHQVLNENADVPILDRSYQGAVVFNPELVGLAHERLDRALGRPFKERALSPEAELATPHQTFFRVFAHSLERRNRELAALYETLAARTDSLEQLQTVVKTMLSRTAWEDAQLVRDQGSEVEGGGGDSRLQPLTILTTDIQGFTTLNAQVPVNRLIDDLNRYFDTLATTVYQERGDVDKFLGDGMLAFFVDPRAALRAACLIQRRIVAFNALQASKQRPTFPTRLGLVTGPCLVARIGSRARQEVTVLGDTVNTSSRLQGLAEVGAVLMDETTYVACGYPPSDPDTVNVRGKQGAQPVYQVLPEVFDAVEAHLRKVAFPED